MPKFACLQVVEVALFGVTFAFKGDFLVGLPMRETTEAVAYVIKSVENVEKHDQKFRLLSQVYALVVEQHSVTQGAGFLLGVAEYYEWPQGDACVVP